MLADTHSVIQIEDARNHPIEAQTVLRQLLEGGVDLKADPKRAGFYEVRSALHTYYIHIFPRSGKILLLATWPNENRPRDRASRQ